MYRLSLAFLCLAFTLPAAAQDSSFTTKAPHVVIMDFATGEVLFEKDAREPMAPASMTKNHDGQYDFRSFGKWNYHIGYGI